MTLRFLILLAILLHGPTSWSDESPTLSRPNILWFVVDDMSAHFSCYGENLIETPHVDRLAREGMRFTEAHVTAPVCSTCRSALMTGMHQASLGVQHHRSSHAQAKIHLPASVTPLPVLMQRAGYYTCNGSGLPPSSGIKQRTKTDYNFVWDRRMYDANDWAGRKEGQPFFMQVQMAGGKLRGADLESFAKINAKALATFGDSIDPKAIELPEYYPDDPVLIQDWVAYLNSVRMTDWHVGLVMDRLEREGILDETLIIFMTDHGISHARGKQFLYREGTHVPFVLRGPGVAAGKVRTDPIEHIDMTAITLAAAGLPIPSQMHGRNILAPDYIARNAVFSARDRCDETIDFIRSVRMGGLLYIRNYFPFRPHLQPSRYKDGKLIVKQLRRLNASDQLAPLSKQQFFSRTRPGEELYDFHLDPYEVNNLVDSPGHRARLEDMRRRLDQHLIESRDAGFLPEPTMSRIALDSTQTIHAFVQSDRDYPLKEIIRLANIGIRGEIENRSVLRAALRHDNPVIRFWAMNGLRVLGSAAQLSEEELERGSRDGDLSVRIATAAVMEAHGARDRAIQLLVQEVQHSNFDAHAFWALDGIKYFDRPEVIRSLDRSEAVKGEYSGRTFDFLIAGGRVYQEPHQN